MEGQWSEPSSGAEASDVRFLRSRGADRFEHSGRTLLTHLIGTYRTLRRWDSESPVCRAGLFHSIYGTASFHPQLVALEDRPLVRQQIGIRAELLAYLFCSIDSGVIANLIEDTPPYVAPCRETDAYVALERQDLIDLTSIKWANLVDQASYAAVSGMQRTWLQCELESSKAILPEEAVIEIENLLQFH